MKIWFSYTSPQDVDKLKFLIRLKFNIFGNDVNYNINTFILGQQYFLDLTENIKQEHFSVQFNLTFRNCQKYVEPIAMYNINCIITLSHPVQMKVRLSEQFSWCMTLCWRRFFLCCKIVSELNEKQLFNHYSKCLVTNFTFKTRYACRNIQILRNIHWAFRNL